MNKEELNIEISGVLSNGAVFTWDVDGNQDCFSVGRHPVCQWYIDDESVAPVHFDLLVEGDQVWIRPRAGLYIDGVLTQSKVPLAEGAVIGFGETRMQLTQISRMAAGSVDARVRAVSASHALLQASDGIHDAPTRIGVFKLASPDSVGTEYDLQSVIVADEPTRIAGQISRRDRSSQNYALRTAMVAPTHIGNVPPGVSRILGKPKGREIVADEPTHIGQIPVPPHAIAVQQAPQESTIILPLVSQTPEHRLAHIPRRGPNSEALFAFGVAQTEVGGPLASAYHSHGAPAQGAAFSEPVEAPTRIHQRPIAPDHDSRARAAGTNPSGYPVQGKPTDDAAIADLFSLPAEARQAPAKSRNHGRKIVLGTAAVAAAVAMAVLFGNRSQASASQPSTAPPPSAPAPVVRPLQAPIVPVQTGPAADSDVIAERDAANHLLAGRLDLALDAYRILAEATPSDRRYPAMVNLVSREISSRCQSQRSVTDPLCVNN